MTDVTTNLKNWKSATGSLPWGVQRTLKDVLSLVKEDKVTLCWGADSYSGHPCLINAISSMISENGVSPAREYPVIVRLFDSINYDFHEVGVNDGQTVSPLAAEILLRNYADLKPASIETDSLTAAEANILLNNTASGKKLMEEIMNEPTRESDRPRA